jgi:hypothetical protein
MKKSLNGSYLFPDNLIIIDGITRSGKFWLADFFGYFENVEPVIHEATMDYICISTFFNELDYCQAKEILRNIVSNKCFNISIGRDLNFRLADSSSIYNNPQRVKYLNRVHSLPDKSFENLKFVDYKNVTFPILSHDWLSIWGVQNEAFPEIKIVRVERNPVDLVFSWLDTRIGIGDMAFGHRCSFDNKTYPWFAIDFIDKFDRLSNTERIILSISYLCKSAWGNIKRLKKNGKSIICTSYEMLGEQPDIEMNRISNFIGRNIISEMDTFITQQRKKNRSYVQLKSAREEKLSLIANSTSEPYMKILIELQHDYENDIQYLMF